MTETTPETGNLYAVPLKVGAFERPCGCNQGTENGESCVLIADVPGVAGAVVLRDSKRPEAGELRFSGAEWVEFLRTQMVRVA
jgi:hypothetical protein